MNRVVFVDTSFWVAISNSRDKYNTIAKTWLANLKKEKVKTITTTAVLLEVGNSLAYLKYRKAAVDLPNYIEEDPMIEIILLTEELYPKGKELYINRPDKEWGLTDCVSFVVMEQRGHWGSAYHRYPFSSGWLPSTTFG